jgi:hypothetical protein
VTSIVGSPVAFSDSSSAYSGGVTVPTGAAGVVAFCAADMGSNGSTLSSLSLTGSGAFQIKQNVPTAAGSFERCGAVAVAAVSSDGSQTFAANWSAGISQGANYFLVFIDEDPTALYRDSDGANTDSSTALSVTADSAATDLVLAMEAGYSAVPSTASGWTSLASEGVYNGQGARVSSADSPGGSTTTFNAESESWSVAVVISIQSAGGGASTAHIPAYLQMLRDNE